MGIVRGFVMAAIRSDDRHAKIMDMLVAQPDMSRFVFLQASDERSPFRPNALRNGAFIHQSRQNDDRAEL